MKVFKDWYKSTGQWDMPGMLIVPDDYATGEPMPLLVFDAGIGEQHQNNLDNMDILLGFGGSLGPPYSAMGYAKAGQLNNIVSPKTKKAYRFAAFCIQGVGWPYPPVDIATGIAQVQAKYKIDPLRIYKTGLSAGGQITMEAIVSPSGGLYAAAVPMSTPWPTVPVDWVKNLKTKVWLFHGTLDGTPTQYANSVNILNSINAGKPGWAKLTSYPNGHTDWWKYYDPNYRETINDISVNIYEWMLWCSDDPNFSFTTTGTTEPPIILPPPIKPPIMETPIIPNVKVVIAKGVFKVDNTLTTGPVGSFKSVWNGKPQPVWDDGNGDGSKPAVKTGYGILPNLNYVLDIWFYSTSGDTTKTVHVTYSIPTDATASATFSSDGTVVIPPVVTKKLVATIKVYDDGSIEKA